MKTCIVVDDDFPQTRLMKTLIAQREDIKCVNSFVSPQKAIEYMSTAHIDIAFLDIGMDELDGIKMSSLMPKNIVIIYVTASPNYALDAYQVDAVDYLLKPVLEQKFNKAVDKAIDLLNIRTINETELKLKEEQTITIFCDRKSFKLSVDEILFIESLREYVRYHTTSQKYMCLSALKDIEKTVSLSMFIRIHKSYIVNKTKVKSYTSTSLVLTNDTELAIGRHYKDSFKIAIKN